ncbi:hypothetical protein [Chitinophaga caseinilytica]|uniref:hypothetical protein n=1 Tax=Chitinophaga caseinilytica TaxID=2267521 RepID=UPI003C2B982C
MRKVLVSLILLACIAGVWLWSSLKEFRKNDDALNSKVKFSGEIVYIKVSGNHAYGVLGIKVASSNVPVFVDSISDAIFPFKIVNDYAEFYGTIILAVKEGQQVTLDTEKRLIEIFDGEKLISRSDVAVSTEEANIRFVKTNTKFK